LDPAISNRFIRGGSDHFGVLVHFVAVVLFVVVV
jgi:hypothetical protein